MMLDFSWKSSDQLLIKSVLVLVYGGLIECMQNFIPGREMLFADIVANATGVLLFIACVPYLKRLNAYQILKLI